MSGVQTPIRVAGRDGLLALVPQLIGFAPTDSVVVVALDGKRVAFAARVDMPRGGFDIAATGRTLADALARHDVRVMLVGYSDDPHAVDTVHAVADFLADVLEVLVVPNGTVKSHAALEAANALSGRGMLPSRAALAQSIAAPTGAALVLALEALSVAVPSDTAADDLLAPGGVTAASAATLAATLANVEARDDLVGRVVREHDTRAWVPALVAALGFLPVESGAEVAAVLAIAAYRVGDGALANLAVDRARAAVPGHRLAGLMVQVMCAGMRPEELDAVLGG
jgi:Domain of unknown function (DUF4192)